MKHKLTLLFALLCASMMTWAVDQDTWIGGNDNYANQFKWYAIDDVTTPMEVFNIQSKDGYDVIFVNVGQADFDRETGIVGCEAITDAGAGVWIKISSLSLIYNDIYFKNSVGTILRGLRIYNAKGTGKSVPTLTVNQMEVTIDASTSETFAITVTYDGDGAVSYESNNEGIATVSDAGVITAKGRGTAIVTIKAPETENYAEVTKKITVNVTGPINWEAIAWLTNSNEQYKLHISPEIVDAYGGKKIEGTNLWVGFPSAVFGDCSIPYSAVGAGVSFALTNFPLIENEFTMNCGGVIYTFYLYNADGASADGLVESITLNQTSATMEVGQSVKLTAEIAPVTAADKSITWMSSDESVATVSDGTIVAQGAGTATIKASANDGSGIFATCSVTVNAVTEKTWWGVGSIDGNGWENVPVMYSITRNLDRTLTYTVYFGGDASGKVIQVCLYNSQYRNLNYNSTEQIATYTTEEKFAAGDKMARHFFFFGGPTIELTDNYSVGDSNEKPSTAVESVVISHSTASLMKDETIQLVASVVPAYADDKTLVWNSEDTNIATVDNNGLVTAVAEGATTITATSNNGKTASCVVTVVGALEPATWYGTAVFEVKGNPVAVNYSITRTSERKLQFYYSLAESIEELGNTSVVFKGAPEIWNTMMKLDANERTAEFTSESTYIDGSTIGIFFHLPFAGGAGRWDVDYIVGSSNEKPNTLVAFGDQADNTAKIAEYANEVVDAYINRTFPNTDEWYTLCLPFDMDEAQLAATFGVGYTLATLGNSEDRGSLIHLNFNYVNTLAAGRPYLLKPGVSTATVPMIEDVTIKNVNPSAAPQKAESAHMHFQGTFAPTTLEGDNKRFVGPNNYLYSPAEGGTNMKSFRCYFTIPVESQALVGSKAARIVLGPQVATGTENVQSDQVPSTKVIIDGTLYIIRGERTYNAQGQLVK